MIVVICRRWEAGRRKGGLYGWPCCLVAQSCLTLCDPAYCSFPGPLVPDISQAGISEWVAFPSPGDRPDPGIELTSSALAGRFFTWAARAAHVVELNLANCQWLFIAVTSKLCTYPVLFPWKKSVICYHKNNVRILTFESGRQRFYRIQTDAI